MHTLHSKMFGNEWWLNCCSVISVPGIHVGLNYAGPLKRKKSSVDQVFPGCFAFFWLECTLMLQLITGSYENNHRFSESHSRLKHENTEIVFCRKKYISGAHVVDQFLLRSTISDMIQSLQEINGSFWFSRLVCQQ